MTKTVLILGANGRFGRNAAQAFGDAGWTVRAFDRSRDRLETAIAGVDVVLNAWSPAGYHLWNETLLQRHFLVATLAAAEGATVILPGNVYVYGPEAGMPWTPDTPHRAENPLGLFRRRLEQGYRAAGGRVIVLRCGDFIDTRATGNWFESHIAKDAHKGAFRYPGDPDVPHAWAFLPDAARAAVALAEAREGLTGFNDIPFAGYTMTGRELAEATGRALGRKVVLKPFAWPVLRLLKPFMPVFRGVFEMRYLWSLPQRLDGGRFASLVPGFAPTPIEDAIRQSLGR